MSLTEPDLVMPWVQGSACLLPGPYPFFLFSHPSPIDLVSTLSASQALAGR